MHENKETPDPPLLVTQIGRLYRILHQGCGKIFREKAFPLEMDQIPVILVVYYTGGLSQQDICLSLQRDKASVNRTVSFLGNRDMVEVIQDSTDKRKTLVKLTVTGKKWAKQANTILQEFDQLLSSALTEEEREQFNRIMTKLIDSPTAK